MLMRSLDFLMNTGENVEDGEGGGPSVMLAELE